VETDLKFSNHKSREIFEGGKLVKLTLGIYMGN